MDAEKGSSIPPQMAGIVLRSLETITSGGEANTVDTYEALTLMLKAFGATRDVIRPDLGMTETCAGCTFSRRCPSQDIADYRQFAALGTCIPGIEMRITVDGALVGHDEPGDLEVRGPIIFSGYINDQLATSNAFTNDGWFKTRDRAFLWSALPYRPVSRSVRHRC